VIPEFNEIGQLPPGVYEATIEEVIARFGAGSEERELCAQSLQWLVPMCRRAGIASLYLNGSFVTDRAAPLDVDCVLLPGDNFIADCDATLAIHVGLPYLSLQVVASMEERDFYLKSAFVTDRQGRPKGIVKVLI
jgi:uncharacterized protein DUF6932